MSARYSKSEDLYARAVRTIPLGAQTFSKSITQLPFGAAPLFAEKALGSRLWDVDGNEYVDFINGLATVTLGYADPDVNEAVMRQLERGTIFSLSTEIEARVAERIVVGVVREPLLGYLNGSLNQRYAGFHDAGITIEWPADSR